jgi:hypothetical protein
MLEGVPDLTLALLNETTQAWLELEYNREVHSEIAMSPVARMLAGPTVARACPGPEDLRRAFRLRDSRVQRRTDGTISVEGVRFEVPARLRHVERLEIRYARWDLSRVDAIDPDTKVIIATLYPLDKQANADSFRRPLQPPTSGALPPKPSGLAPVLRKHLETYRAMGLPPAYLPKDDHDVADPEGRP